jgi:hypothetical protein
MLFEQLSVIAPEYKNGRMLLATKDEIGFLSKFSGYRPVKGNYEGINNLFVDQPQGIVHFAGHGAVKKDSPGAAFSIELEDGALSPDEWKGKYRQIKLDKTRQTLFFFNACELGTSG